MTDETKPEDVKNGAVQIIGPGQAIESSRKLDTFLDKSAKELRRGSLSAKVQSLAMDMDSFNRETHAVVDAVRLRIARARTKRDQAADIYHAHYEALTNDFQDQIDAAERLTNLPLDRNGDES